MKNIGLLLCGLLLGVALAEAALRYLRLPFLPMGVPNLSGFASSIDKPEGRHFHSTNRFGYRALDVSPNEVGDRQVIAVIGDSHTNGVGVDDDERFTDILQRSLDAAGRRLLILNLGVPGTSLNSYRGLLEVAAQYKPFMVVVVLYSGNDIYESLVGRDHLRPEEQGARAAVLQQARKFHLYHLAAQALRPRRQEAMLGVPPCDIRFTNDDYGAFQQQLQQSCELHKKHSASWRKQTEANIVSFIEALQRSGARWRIEILPSKLLVEPEKAQGQSAQVSARWGLNAEDMAAASVEAHDAAVRIARDASGCRGDDPCVDDLLPKLRQLKEGEPLYFPRDWHLSPRGHRALHDAIVEEIRRGVQLDTPSSAAPGGRPSN